MKRTAASRFLILFLIFSAVLALPGGLLAAVTALPDVCPHCQMAGHNSGPCPCCPHHGKSGHCDNASQNGGFNCRCGSSGPAVFAPAVTGTPTWQVAFYVLAMATVSAKLHTPSIFHPPELNSQIQA